ncbi:TetR/AcrR family transcriptional regulator [Rhodococcus sp. NPDC127530]|uniref:TetR/AcrR family transcriptional regulator n=1 Tax=unclassified Rhodococcus (in: high G+C Gram-positive bacteria) TaxID=192944 RepID=UPI00363B5FF3
MTTSTSPAQAISHKERLLREGMRLVYAHGFHGTTVDAVLAAAGVPKGSFYHHFGSKEAFTQALLDRYTDYQSGLLAEWIRKDGLNASAKLTGYFSQMAEHFVRTGYQRACLAGKLSTEVGATSEVFRSQLNRSIHAMKDDIAGLLTQGQQAGDVRTDRSADDMADGVLALIQGSFVVALSTRDEHSLAAVTDTIASVIEPVA